MGIASLLTTFLTPTTAAPLAGSPAQHHLTVFEHVGDVIPDVSFIHVIMPVDLDKFDKMFTGAIDLLNQDSKTMRQQEIYQNEVYYHPKTETQHDLFIEPGGEKGPGRRANISVLHDLMDIHQQYLDLRNTLPSNSPSIRNSMLNAGPQGNRYLSGVTYHQQFNMTPTSRTGRRQKRFWGGLIGGMLGMATIATFMGVFDQTQIHSLSGKDSDLLVKDNERKNEMIETLNHRISRALDIAREEAGNSVFMNRYMVWTAVVRHLQRRLNEFASLLENLQKHRLSNIWFSSQQMHEIHQNVHTFGKSHQVIPLTEFSSDYFQIDTSFVTTSDQLLMILHVPSTRAKEKWHIFRYKPFPIPDNNNMVKMVTSPEQLIALGADKRYKVLSEADLHHCLRRNHVYMCNSPVITHTDFGSSCIGAIMGQMSDRIVELCQIHMEPSREIVLQASEQTFAVYSPEPFTAHGTCVNGTLTRKLMGISSIVSLSPGCSLQLKEHVIDAPFSLTLPKQPIIEQTSWDTLDVPRRLLQHEDQRQTKLYGMLVNDSYDVSKLEDGLRLSQAQLAKLHDRLSKQVAESHGFLFWSGVIISSILVVLISLLTACWCARYWCPASRVFSRAPSLRFPSDRELAARYSVHSDQVNFTPSSSFHHMDGQPQPQPMYA